jgi:hypothetical protein
MVKISRSEERWAHEGARPVRYPWLRTGSVDVEVLAAWAYGAQQVDRFERVGLNAIEAAASGFEPRGFSGDGVGQLMQIEHLGCRIDAGHGLVRDTVHPAAYAVAQAVGECEHGGRVRYHALSGSRPVAWRAPEHKVRPVVWTKPGAEAQVEYQGPGRKGGYCRVIIAWDAARERWGQLEYAMWWAGLDELVWRLSQRALGFVVTGPAAPAAPWHESGERAEPSPISLDPEAGAGTPPRGSSQRAQP